MSRSNSLAVLALIWASLGVTAAACVAAPSIPPLPNTEPAMPAQVTPPTPFAEAPEMAFAAVGAPLPDGPVSGLVGLYGEYGADTLITCRIETSQMLCSRYPVELGAPRPQMVEVVEVAGQVGGARLSVDSWKPLTWDESAQLAAAQAHLAELAPALAAYDWSRIARPDFAASSRQYHPTEAQLKALAIALAGYDRASDRFIWRAQGPDMPQQKQLVRRYPALYILTDPTYKTPPEMFVTIEGYVEE